jgi:hypothetical protein
MNFTNILATAVLASMAANSLHWYCLGNGEIQHYLSPGWLRLLFTSWTIVTGCAAVGFLLGSVPAVAFLSIGVGLTVAQQMYSIARRQGAKVVS